MKNFSLRFFLSLIIFLIFYLTLVLFDIFLARLPKLLSENYKTSQKIFWDNQEKSNKIKQIKNENYINQIYISDYQLYPFNQVSKKRNFIAFAPPGLQNYFKCDEGYGTIKHTSDRFGFRNDDSLWDEELDVVLIGDSFASGQCVDKKNSLSGILNNNKIKTLILAHGGTSAVHYDFYLKTFIPLLKPKKIIIALHENDNHLIDTVELHANFLSKIKTNDYVSIKNNKFYPSTKLNEFNKDILDLYKFNLNFTVKEKLLFKIDKLKKYFYLPNIKFYVHHLFNNSRLIGHNKSLIDNAISLCNINTCKVYFVLVRSSNFWDPTFFYEKYKNSLSGYLSLKGYKLITFDHLIDYRDKKYYAPTGPHFSILGYELIAEEIIKSIKE